MNCPVSISRRLTWVQTTAESLYRWVVSNSADCRLRDGRSKRNTTSKHYLKSEITYQTGDYFSFVDRYLSTKSPRLSRQNPYLSIAVDKRKFVTAMRRPAPVSRSLSQRTACRWTSRPCSADRRESGSSCSDTWSGFLQKVLWQFLLWNWRIINLDGCRTNVSSPFGINNAPVVSPPH
jgi:hypothetical protein